MSGQNESTSSDPDVWRARLNHRTGGIYYVNSAGQKWAETGGVGEPPNVRGAQGHLEGMKVALENVAWRSWLKAERKWDNLMSKNKQEEPEPENMRTSFGGGKKHTRKKHTRKKHTRRNRTNKYNKTKKKRSKKKKSKKRSKSRR